ncbi:hypothetical protein AQI88_06920 [Streptomyces cellostaticus]|uniref:DUF4097 domain-containing protein n=1 Tax=Streptomyces cellostaticus TaxID=67285 RepID=A0A101NQQ9_9ACTN|nr:DUF4097 family beta strand repeat-containing protein [Streptomyces cellostaticus]KUM97644.1 hypothetical protein AQI88_06920 [Streptomyces cellostaticus]GHI08064.1 lipoprotein [Streptomyces cellostaticus]
MTRSLPARSAVAGLLVGGLVAGVSACGADARDDKHPDHRSFALHGHTLTVDSDDAALEIVAAKGKKAGTVEVTRWFKGSVTVGSGPKVSWTFKDDRLVLRVHCSGLIADCSARYRVEVPHGAGVKVVDANGGVQAHGFTDPLSIHTDNGAVHVTDSTGPLDLRSDNGAVRADAASRRVRAGTSNGSVHLELGGVPDLVDATSDNGAVTVALPRTAYDVKAGSDNGQVSVSVPQDDRSPHTVTAHSSNGKVTVRTAN